MKDGFHQIQMKPEHKYLTAMSTPLGTYVWKVMPMGLKNAQAIFQRIMEWVLKDIPKADPYIDDVVIVSIGDTMPETV